MEELALHQLSDIGALMSLRYAVQIVGPARIVAETIGRSAINDEDVGFVDKLFLDGKASGIMLAKSEGYMH